MNLKKILALISLILFSQLVNADISRMTGIARPNIEYLADIDNTYAIQKALYREILSLGYERIVAIVNRQALKPDTWGVIFALDNTLINPKTQLANPGTELLTCKIKNRGGRVVVVSNRYNINPGESAFIDQTTRILKNQGFCFDSIVFANNQKDTDKNPRFAAVASGDYENITTSKVMNGFKVLAYFGSKMGDFPNLKENLAEQLPVNDDMFKDFGQQYFILPH